jgi:hypothetical protein
MLGPSQATLLALWAALGSSRFIWRVPAIVVGLVVDLRLVTDLERGWKNLTVLQFVYMVALLFIARFAGIRLSNSRQYSRSALQFTVRDILTFMTSLAIILGALHYMADLEQYLPDRPSEVFAFLGSFALVAGSALYCALGNRWLLARIAVVPLATLVGAYSIKMYDSWNWLTIWMWELLLSLMAVWLVGSLFMVRLAGYRLTWQSPCRHNDFVPDDFLKDEKEAEDANQ